MFKSYPHLKPMDKYAKKVAQRLFKKHPLWLPYARIEEYNDEHYLVVEVKSPVNPSERDLLISTYDHEITIHFDRYHTHFDCWQDVDFETSFGYAMNFIDKVFCEAYIVGICIEDGQWKGSKMFTPETIEQIDPKEVSYTRSWLGTFDRQY